MSTLKFQRTQNDKVVTIVQAGRSNLPLGTFVNVTVGGFEQITEVPFDTFSTNFTGGTRKRYPGDAGVQFSGGVRNRTNEKALPNKTTPGKRFWMERPTGEGQSYRSNAQQFTYLGNWTTLKAAIRATAIGTSFILRNESGVAVNVVPD